MGKGTRHWNSKTSLTILTCVYAYPFNAKLICLLTLQHRHFSLHYFANHIQYWWRSIRQNPQSSSNCAHNPQPHLYHSFGFSTIGTQSTLGLFFWSFKLSIVWKSTRFNTGVLGTITEMDFRNRWDSSALHFRKKQTCEPSQWASVIPRQLLYIICLILKRVFRGLRLLIMITVDLVSARLEWWFQWHSCWIYENGKQSILLN